MYEKDRTFVTAQVLRVLADWGVVASGVGSGEGDVAYWVDTILAHKGWEPYWEEDRMPREFTKNGHTKGAPPPVVPAGDPYMVKLDAILADVQILKAGLRRYF